MGTTLNPNILFRLSGLSQGMYTFEQNPETMDILAPRQVNNKLELLQGENIYQRPLFDNEVRVMKWSVGSTLLYENLKSYTQRTSSGTIPTSYFWDGTIKEFQGAAVEVIDVHGKPLNADIGKWEIELQFKPTNPFDKKYDVTVISGAVI